MPVDADAHYRMAREALELSEKADSEAATRLAKRLVDRFVLDPSRLRPRIEGRPVLVLGAAEADLDAVARASRSMPTLVAGSAIGPAFHAGVRPVACVSDLDGDGEAHVAYSRAGVPLVVLAHGDNVALVDELVPRFVGPLVGTSQTPPPERPVRLHRFGGFTDGDRACYLAQEMGATQVLLVGFELEDADVGRRKGIKLGLARAMLEGMDVDVTTWTH